jgi:nucleoside-diphosphate-sugar epimerase
MKRNTILIGPTGFLGPAFLESDSSMIAVGRSPLPAHLKNPYIHIDSDLDFSPIDDVEFDNVIFLIGSSDHEILNKHPTLAIEKNVLALSRFLSHLRDTGRKVNKIINFTTMLQYDSNKMTLPCDETQPRNPCINNYVLSKYVSELITQQYRDFFSIIDVRISNVYGPTRLVRPDIVPSLIWSVLTDDSCSVWTKKPKRDFIHVEDAIGAVSLLLGTDYSGPVNLGTGCGRSVGELCEILESLSGVEIKDKELKVSGHMEFYQDISLLNKLTGWEPRYTLEEGIANTYIAMKSYLEANEGPIN